MTSSPIEDIGLWEAWVEYDQFDPNCFGTLYIIGEISTEHTVSRPFTKLDTSNKKQLVLQVPAVPSARRVRMKEVLFSEPIKSIDAYTSIHIYAGDELIASFNEIEIMI